MMVPMRYLLSSSCNVEIHILMPMSMPLISVYMLTCHVWTSFPISNEPSTRTEVCSKLSQGLTSLKC